MKKNLPVTDNEVTFSDDDEIISTTDLKGLITGCNKTFTDVSGFTPDELIGVSHNVVRHPDMAPASFADLWQHMKSEKHWMGIVKNRCKNGDYYWVDAYVTPIIENGQVTGYESVRTKPSAENVARSKKIHQALNNGTSPNPNNFIQRQSITNRTMIANISSVLLAGLAMVFTKNTIGEFSYLVAIVIALTTIYVGNKWALFPLTQAVKVAQKEVNNPIMALVYTGRDDEIGKIQLPQILMQAKLRTILGRISDASSQIRQSASHSSIAVQEINKTLHTQTAETDSVAAAITEMTASVSEVARTAAYASNAAADADSHSKEGVRHALGAAEGLHTMTSTVNNIANVISQLAEDTKNIDAILTVIQSVSEQTNLLALNAAIEAARAGEQGRGFAVVADEVRTLASRTRDSTEEIQSLISKLNSAVETAVSVLGNSQESAILSENLITNAIESLKEIATQIHNINDINAQIAIAAEEQTNVSHEVSGNVNRISHASADALHGASTAKNSAIELASYADNLQKMMVRFRTG